MMKLTILFLSISVLSSAAFASDRCAQRIENNWDNEQLINTRCEKDSGSGKGFWRKLFEGEHFVIACCSNS